MSEVDSLLRRVQAAEDRIDRLERLVEILRKENK
jgi:hypothetical protein|tara:strand:+ start:82 stop:183 length:102 start_codon:yes stop_codon:yes gene_type:complete